jgi:hypothetical protein
MTFTQQSLKLNQTEQWGEKGLCQAPITKMVTKVLCVAEKPSIAKAVANHLAGQNVQTVSRALVFILPKQR